MGFLMVRFTGTLWHFILLGILWLVVLDTGAFHLELCTWWWIKLGGTFYWYFMVIYTYWYFVIGGTWYLVLLFCICWWLIIIRLMPRSILGNISELSGAKKQVWARTVLFKYFTMLEAFCKFHIARESSNSKITLVL